jgi:hypothetical protein
MAGQQVSPQQVNQAQRAAVLSQAVPRQQIIQTGSFNPATSGPLQIVPRNVGLLTSFRIRFTATITNNDPANALTLTDLGLANFLSNIQFTDLNNNVRLNTAGWHLSFINSIKMHKPFASGYMIETDEMGGYGENFPILSAPQSVAANGGVAQIACIYDVPLAYNQDDLRGAIYMGVVSASALLQLTVNPTPFTAAGVDSTLAMYHGTTLATLSNVGFECYQNYLDQLPIGQGGVVLPILDLSTIYELKTTTFSAIPQGQDFPIPFANFRDFLSSAIIFNNNSTVDTGRTPGSDLNYIALQSANFTNLWKKSPLMQALDTRSILGTDLPVGCYYTSFRRRPISTTQYGNMELVLNAITAGANAYALVGWEDFALVNTLTQAGSLAG